MSSCSKVEKALACFTDAAGVPTSIFAHTVYDADGAAIALYYTNPVDNAVIDTSVGTVTAGACPVAQPDVEWNKLCDVAADGTVTQFMCRTITRFNPDGTVIDPVQVDNFETDKVTAYTVAGTVGDCATCPDQAPIGLITDLSLLSA